jgi:sugar (pentulose or hexulose) kinase
MVLPNPEGGGKKEVLIGAYMTPGKFVMETNAGQSGLVYDWAVKTFVGAGDNAYADAERMLSGVERGPTGVSSYLGSQIMMLQKIHVLKPSVLVFPSPMLPPFFKTDASVLLKASLEEVAFAIASNLELLEAFSKQKASVIGLNGGMSRNKTFCDVLSNAVNRPVQVSKQADGTMLGASLCAMVGSQVYPDFETASKEAVHIGRVANPDPSVAAEYSEAKTKWKDTYFTILGLVEEGKM